MSQIIQRLDQQQLKSLCGVVAHTSEGLTKSELTTLLGQCGICAVDDGSSRNQLGYTIGLNKRDWLYNCLVTEINKSQSFSRVFSFLQAALNNLCTRPNSQAIQRVSRHRYSQPCPPSSHNKR